MQGEEIEIVRADQVKNTKEYHYDVVQNEYNKKVFEIRFNSRQADNSIGNPVWKWPFNEEATLMMTYRISKNALVGKNGNYDQGQLKNIDDGYLLNGAWTTDSKESVVSDKLTRSIRKRGEVVDAKQGIVEYTVYINPDYTGEITGNPFIDVFDSDLEYENNSFQVRLYSNAWGLPSGVEVATISGNPTIVDNQLAFDLNIQGAGWTVKQGAMYNHYYGWDNAASIKNHSDWYNKTDYQDDGVTKTSRLRLEMTYRMKVKDNAIKDLGGDSIGLTNTASMQGFGSATAYVSYKPKLLDKAFAAYQNGVAKYEILVNEKGITLSDASHPLTLTDVMTNLTPDLASIKVYEISLDGTASEMQKEWSVHYDGNNTLTFALPDGTPLKITYDAYPQTASGTVQVSNTATLTGKKSETSEVRHEIQVAGGSGSGGGAGMMFLIYKVDKETRAPLEDVEFTIERFEHEEESGEFRGTWTNHGGASIKTDKQGQIKADKIGEETLHNQYLYRIREVKPKAGYAGGKGYIYFTFPKGDSFEADYTAWSEIWKTKGIEAISKDQIHQLSYASSVTVENERIQSYSFTKTDTFGNGLEGATFTLTDTSVNNPEAPRTATSGETGTVTFTDLKPNKTYWLEETRAPGGYLLSTETWMIAVRENGEMTVTDGNGKTVEKPNGGYRFANREIPTLPSVGGRGTAAYGLLGLALMAMATAAYMLARRKKASGAE